MLFAGRKISIVIERRLSNEEGGLSGAVRGCGGMGDL